MLRKVVDWFRLREPKRGLVSVDVKSGVATPVEDTPDGKLWLRIKNGTCPDCGAKGFYEGPSGGLSTNIFCANPQCRAGFNVTPAVGIAERIHKGDIKRYPISSVESA